MRTVELSRVFKILEFAMSSEPQIDTSPEVSDEIRQTTCYMCACRCGINVHIRDDKIRYIEGNRDHPINKGFYVPKVQPG